MRAVKRINLFNKKNLKGNVSFFSITVCDFSFLFTDFRKDNFGGILRQEIELVSH